MDNLPLTPLPSETSDDAKGYRRVFSDGFVDESVVLSVIAKGPYERVYAKPEDMVLSSNEDDYAGWALPVPSPFRTLLGVANPEPTTDTKLPAPPSLKGIRKFSEAGLDEPHRGNHRWWLFALSGVMTCGIFSLTLLSLAQRSSLREAMTGYMPIPRKTEVSEIATKERDSAPALVKILPSE